MPGIQLPIRRIKGGASRRLVLVTMLMSWLVTLFTPSWVMAQSEADRATARNLAAEGYTALKTQDFVTAEDRFRRADALVHAPTLVVDHARALIGLGRYVEAQERLELVAREGVAENAPWVWKKAIQDAEQLVEFVKPKVAWLTINVTGPSDPLVLVDGTQVPVAALGVRRAVDPGNRRIGATANGYRPREVTVNMPEGGERAVTLELPLDPGATASVPRTETKPKESPLLRSNPDKKSSPVLTYVAFGLGGLGLVAGTVSGFVALGKRSELIDKCDGSRICEYKRTESIPVDQTALADEYRRYGIISGISLGVGVASTAVGVWLLVSNKNREAPQRSTNAAVVPYLSIGDVGLRGVF